MPNYATICSMYTSHISYYSLLQVFSIDITLNVVHNDRIMKAATFRQLRNDTNTLLKWIEHGEAVTITKRSQFLRVARDCALKRGSEDQRT